MTEQHVYEVRPREDHRGVDLISDELAGGPLFFEGPDAVEHAVSYAKSHGKVHGAIIRVYDIVGNLIATHKQVSQAILKKRIAQLGEPIKAASKPHEKTIFVVVEIEKAPDDYYGNCAFKTPIAAFIHRANASEFVASKQSEGFLYLEWNIVEIPVADLNPYMGLL